MNTLYSKVNKQEKIEFRSEDIHKDFEPMIYDITCPICIQIVILPISCAECHKLICKDCMSNWFLKSQRCPHSNNHNFKELNNTLAKNFLDKIKFNCPNKKIGCNKEIFYEDYIKHCKSECQYEKYMCNGCDMQGTKSIIESHVKLCDQIEGQCEFCKASIKLKYLSNHKLYCDERLMDCEPCKLKIKQSNFALHKFNCPEKVIECEFCNKSYPKKLEVDHTKELCFGEIKRSHKVYVNQLLDKIKEKDKLIEDLQNKIANNNIASTSKQGKCEWCGVIKELKYCCSLCKETWYCLIDCMERDKNFHKDKCIKLRKI